MPLPVPEPGLVVSYPYLWHSEYEQDQEEGLKDRRCAIILVAEDAAGETLVTVVPITHSAPASDPVEIPLAVKRRLGLDVAFLDGGERVQPLRLAGSRPGVR